MTKRFLGLIALLLLVNGGVFGQGYPGARGGGRGAGSNIKGRVTGTIMDAELNVPIEFATIAIKKEDGSIVNGSIADADGKFRIIEIPMGTYTVEISFVGYEGISQQIELTPREPDANLGTLSLASNTQALEEVVVEGERDLIENRIDKIVYNSEQDIANRGGNAADVLRRTPLLSVDLEGNVQLRGSSNIQVLLNGKPSSLFSGGNLAAALNALPADQIVSVEVITAPSAKYDGEGSAGIVNIITKKKTLEGFAGNVNLSVGTRQNSAVVGISTGKGRFGFNMNSNMFYSWPRLTTNTLVRTVDQGDGLTQTLTDEGGQNAYTLGGFLSGGFFYDFNAYHSLNANFRGRGFDRGGAGNFTTTFEDQLLGINQEYSRFLDDRSFSSGFEGSMDYVAKFPGNPKQEFTASYQLDGSIQDQRQVIQQQDDIGSDLSLFRDEVNVNDGDNREHTIQLNYAHPFGEVLLLEVGAKGIFRNLTSTYTYDTLNQETKEYVENQDLSDVLNYTQNVEAGFIQTNWTLSENWSILAGIRYEATQIGGSFRDQSEEATFANNYDNWLPSVTVSRKLNRFTSLKASYTQRIQRPNLRFINPFQNTAQQRNISTGNPDLEAEVTDQYELSYSTFIKGSAINASVFFRQTDDVITSYLDPETGITTFANIGVNNSIGANFFGSTTLWEIFTIRGNVNASTFNASGTLNGEELSRQAIIWGGNMSGTVKLPKDWTIEGFGFYRAPRQTIQGFQRSFSLLSIGIQKQIWDKKGAIGLRIVEPFVVNKQFGGISEGVGFTQENVILVPFQSFGLSFRYNFGKIGDRVRGRRSRINNDDVQEGGDGRSGGFGR
ncbi:MAG: TonB-dependent receptor [Bacteroidota bacterium]